MDGLKGLRVSRAKRGLSGLLLVALPRELLLVRLCVLSVARERDPFDVRRLRGVSVLVASLHVSKAWLQGLDEPVPKGLCRQRTCIATAWPQGLGVPALKGHCHQGISIAASKGGVL